MDPNANAGKPDPVNPPPRHHDIAEPGPIDPATGQPDHGAEVSALKAWLRENRVSLVVTAVVVALVVIYLDPIDTLKVVIGLGLVIFIHELGHFLAAKWCDVHVSTFSIGFGPAVPFCSYKWGETTYMVGIIPLGGYVQMVGEGDGAESEDADDDPRSFRKKSVGQRMLIISAGVIMNILLGMACFVAAYMHGVREEPAIPGTIVSGGAAWQAGLRSGDHIVSIEDRASPTFKDLRPVVMSTDAGETVSVVVKRDGEELKVDVEPLREEGTYFPALGIHAQSRLTLLKQKKRGLPPVVPGSPAAAVKDPGFQPGDRIVAMTDPTDPAGAVTPIRSDPRDPDGGPDVTEYYRRMAKLAGRPVTLRVVRENGNDTAEVVVQPAYRSDLGVRMRMGEVAALRKGGPAEKAGVVAHSDDPAVPGDRIKTVKLPEPGGAQTWLTTGDAAGGRRLTGVPFRPVVFPDGTVAFPTGGGDLFTLPARQTVTVRTLDPMLLPLELKKWADRTPPADRTVRVEVLRKVGHDETKAVELALPYDEAYRYDREVLSLPNSPLPLGGLGLAYWVDAVVDAVAPGGPADGKLQKDDVVTQIRFHAPDGAGGTKPGEWEEIKARQWASAEAAFQSRPPHRIDLKVKRGESEVEVSLDGRPDRDWPTDDRGLVFQPDFRVHQATDIGNALTLGARRTLRFIKEVYMNLYAMAFGRVSAKTMSGPLTIANVSYKFAGEDFWQFLLFLGMISVNLAVVNFLPIPVLDGGHMVFLVLEWILGRPVPEKVFAAAMWMGVFLILSLMVFVLVLDIRRLFFGWF